MLANYDDYYAPYFCSTDGQYIFDTLNLNTQASWNTEDKREEGVEISILELQQVEKNTFFIGTDRIL